LINLRTLLFAALLPGIAVSGELVVPAQTQPETLRLKRVPPPETARAIELSQQGQNVEAISALQNAIKQNKNDVQAWHYLALAREKQGNANEARKAHEKAALLGEKLVSRTLDGRPQRDADFAGILQPIGAQLTAAYESAVRYMQSDEKLKGSKREDWSMRTESLRAFADLANADPANKTVFRPKEVDVKARILEKPEPEYTEEARMDGVTGTVVLCAILTADGKITGIHTLKSLPRGLTKQALQVAREIKFVPAVKNGKPVATIIMLEYHFNLH
jgi:TonB family protein